ncbi:Aste57867_16966 [Aphanomyces stellatus]|uniref:Aste57867_16966 protein n=1 Tax=Aphanomyces stellatus TaxID=120398 RepID=A0A485L706_9STRA|nr:hypothetical protein As57867_016908 [Aphanomyces stellatus]VFT93728.1 Aste57867_16966 [Aphanomyces stellatus]
MAADLTTTSGSVYQFLRQGNAHATLLQSQKTMEIHHMAKHIRPPPEHDDGDDMYDGSNKTVHPTKLCSMSLVATKTFLPYKSQTSSTAVGVSTDVSPSDTFLVHNFGDYLFLFPYDDIQTPLDIMKFTQTPMCHDFRVPMLPTQPTNLVLALASSDILVFDPLHGLDTATHHNREGAICASPITATTWVKQSHTQFVVAHANGAMYIYDHTFHDESSDSMDVEQPEGEFTLLRQREDRTNPLMCWQVSTQALLDVAFSPNGKYLACVGKTGLLSVFQYHMQRKIAMMQSHFGALTCLSWSPNSLYILTGGQDDTVIVWSLQHNMAVARCEGHVSWITSVAFDPWFSSLTALRFGSVGEDGLLCLWDFALPQPDDTKLYELTPVLRTAVAGGTPLAHVVFRADSIAVSARDGTVLVYARPPDDALPSPVLAQTVPSYSFN